MIYVHHTHIKSICFEYRLYFVIQYGFLYWIIIWISKRSPWIFSQEYVVISQQTVLLCSATSSHSSQSAFAPTLRWMGSQINSFFPGLPTVAKEKCCSMMSLLLKKKHWMKKVKKEVFLFWYDPKSRWSGITKLWLRPKTWSGMTKHGLG